MNFQDILNNPVIQKALNTVRFKGFIEGYEITNNFNAMIWQDGKLKENQTNITIACLRQGDVCLDVGTNIGYYTFVMSKCVGKTGQVYSFEPVPETFEYLNQNLAELKITNVKTYQMAISDQVAIGDLIYEFPCDLNACIKNQGFYILDDKLGQDMIPKCEIQCITIEKFVEDNLLDKLNFIKLDCQGSDLLILQSSVDIIKRFKPKIICEALGDNLIKQTNEFFRDIGYYSCCIEKGYSGNILTEHILGIPLTS